MLSLLLLSTELAFSQNYILYLQMSLLSTYSELSVHHCICNTRIEAFFTSKYHITLLKTEFADLLPSHSYVLLQHYTVLNILNISTSSANESLPFTDHLWVCWRPQISVEFIWWQHCIVKTARLFLPSASFLSPNYLSMWRALYYPRATWFLRWVILSKALWNSMGTASMASSSSTRSLLNSTTQSWETGLSFSKPESSSIYYTHPCVH